MEKIPQFVLEDFKVTYNMNASIFNLNLSEGILKSLLKKSKTLWLNADVNEGQIILEEYLQYSEDGVRVYYIKEDDSYNVYFLFNINKREIVEFIVHNIKRLKK
jgi:hypothetical protein